MSPKYDRLEKEIKELQERIMLAELNADIGASLSIGETSHQMLHGCTDALVKHLDALFARIWVYNESSNMLELQASSGLYTHTDGKHSSIEVGKNKVGSIAKERKPIMTNEVIGDPFIADQKWAKEEGVVSFAGLPLIIENHLVGVMALFSRNPITEIAIKGLISMADLIALGIERKVVEERLKEAVITDELTGLFNRRGFFTLAEQQYKLADRTRRPMHLMYLDLDGFKRINDKYGHKVGDRVLVDTANILKRTFRESDIIARIGGDEFVVLFAEPSDPDMENIVIEHLKNNLRIYNDRGAGHYRIMLSMGVSRYDPQHPCSISELLTRADRLMYKEKKQHKTEGELAEDRAHIRYDTGETNWAELDYVDMVKLKNISVGGICLRTSEELKPSSTYCIKEVCCNDEKTTLKGQVIWSRLFKALTEEKITLPIYEVGLKFIDITEHKKRSLESITTLLASNPPRPHSLI